MTPREHRPGGGGPRDPRGQQRHDTGRGREGAGSLDTSGILLRQKDGENLPVELFDTVAQRVAKQVAGDGSRFGARVTVLDKTLLESEDAESGRPTNGGNGGNGSASKKEFGVA